MGFFLFTDPKLPSLPPSFQTRIEANILDMNYSISAVEYVDDENNRANTCTVSNLTGDANTVIFGGGGAAGGIPHVYSTAGVLHFAKELGETYMGSGTLVRGLKANHWQTCMYWPVVRANFTLDYYFSVPGWNNSAGAPSVPLRAEVTGIYTIINDVTQQFHHIYDYIDFRTSPPDDPSVYETPAGISCPGRKKVRDMPKLKSKYYYREEIISPGGQQIQQADVWYDFDWQLLRYDSRPLDISPPYNSLNPYTEIHDYNTGVAYAMDKLIKNCTIMPIENGTWDSAYNSSRQFLHMRSPGSLFFLDDSYAYSGQRKARGIDCDVYTSTRADFSDGLNVFEMYFLREDWSAMDNIGLDTDTPDIPIRLTITGPGDFGFTVIYELYDFDQETPDIQTAFDISNCYNDFEKIDFRITFPSKAGNLLSEYRTIFIDQAILLIASLSGGLSPLRITRTEVHWDDSNVYMIGTLLDKAPPIAKYVKMPSKVAPFKNALTLQGVTDPTSCAEQCDSVDTFTCNSFDICAGKQVCTLSKDYNSDGVKLSDSLECDHYTRVVGGRVDKEIALNDAWIVLTDQVVKGTFQVTLNLDDGSKQVLKGSDITSDVLRNPNRVASKTALQHFSGQANKQVNGFDDLILTGTSIDDCANECLGEIVFSCQSFEYCYDTGYCVMSHTHPDERPDLIIASDHCDLYTRSYTAKFTETPGTTVLSSSDTIYQNINSDNQCARLCVDYNEFDCKSFDYCPNINTCFLGRKHVFDVPKSNIQEDPQCNHYSRNYADDFKLKAHKEIALRDNRVIEGVSAEQCAKMCVEEESFSCASFDYCGNMTECRLSDAAMSDIGQVTIEASTFCEVYIRSYYPDGSVYTKPVASGYSSGAMGGLGFAMLVLGALLAVGIYVAIGKYQGKSLDSMTISFKNMENSD
ncbi:uncharacterized protein LOC126818106 [Patella vulgata]|uniref:uncharacterized protein LOC126818106 n=1 Tax=Patella vulgata TaxID=6465 RepID=UPI0024A8864E|nr:uncharacterized protein LOC126818106 [Patella vulgata]